MLPKTYLGVLFLFSCVFTAKGHATSSGVLDSTTFSNHLLHHFEKFDEVRHPRDASKMQWEESRDYVTTVFDKIGLNVELQCFNTSVLIEYDNDKMVTGCNIIGISKGPSTKNLMIVGAHYDSSGSKLNNQPLRDNGAGISLLLEVARAYEDSWRWKGWATNYTTMFVAFDLNTKEQFPESRGHPGSYFFVNEWLIPKLQMERRTLGGSIILDSIATFNAEPNTQILPADFISIFPEAYSNIVNNSKAGDYIAVVSPGKEESAELVKDFSGHYRMDRMRRPYRLQEMIAESNEFGVGSTFRTLDHQASYHFWTAKPTLPSILITDTGDQRTLPVGEQCADETRDCNYIFANDERMNFLYSTYKALIFTLLDRQATFVGLTESGGGAVMGSTLGATLFPLVASLLLARMIYRF